MITVMRDFNLVGMACNQIGMPYRIVTMEFNESLKKDFSSKLYEIREMATLSLTVLINPIIKPTSFDKVTFVESCASVRGNYYHILLHVRNLNHIFIHFKDTQRKLHATNPLQLMHSMKMAKMCHYN